MLASIRTKMKILFFLLTLMGIFPALWFALALVARTTPTADAQRPQIRALDGSAFREHFFENEGTVAVRLFGATVYVSPATTRIQFCCALGVVIASVSLVICLWILMFVKFRTAV
jgi:hypothetical protein